MKRFTKLKNLYIRTECIDGVLIEREDIHIGNFVSIKVKIISKDLGNFKTKFYSGDEEAEAELLELKEWLDEAEQKLSKKVKRSKRIGGHNEKET